MIALGLILLLLGLLVAGLHALVVIGVVLLVIGLVVNFVPVGGNTRRWY